MSKCAHCGDPFEPNPRVKNQEYCGKKECQRERKRVWQQEKMKSDPDYKANQQDCQKRWRDKNPDYWRKYRSQHPEYVERNRLLQKERDKKRRILNLANMDSLERDPFVKPGAYYLVPAEANLANMDASAQKVVLIPTG